jgi:CubicO group peptidase (beta-lactamase class C family)
MTISTLPKRAPLVALFYLLCMLAAASARAQSLAAAADSIRRHYGIPELAYAVISSDSIVEMQVLGVKRNGSTIPAEPADRFHLGSNTKGITGFIAALLVARKKIAWETKLFDLYPELRRRSNAAYAGVTLRELLTHRARLPGLHIGDVFPVASAFTGDAAHRRLQFGAWILRQKPVSTRNGYFFSNAGYIVAALMLERASGRSWEELVGDLGTELGIDFHFSYPNVNDSLQPWGHDDRGRPVPPRVHEKEELLSAAGNINASVAGYGRFVREQLRGLRGLSPLMTAEEFAFVHYGTPLFAIGWEPGRDNAGHLISGHHGSAGTFCSQVCILPHADRAYVILTNSAPERTFDGIEALYAIMKSRYGG